MFSNVCPCLPMFAHFYSCLCNFTHFTLPKLTYVYWVIESRHKYMVLYHATYGDAMVALVTLRTSTYLRIIINGTYAVQNKKAVILD